jgi:hypothetical protein
MTGCNGISRPAGRCHHASRLFARHHDKLTAHLEQARSKQGAGEGATDGAE